VADLPGCIATGVSMDEVESRIREAIKFHLDGLIEDGETIPVAQCVVGYSGISVGDLT